MRKRARASSLLLFAIAYCDDKIAILQRQRRQLINDAKREGVAIPRRVARVGKR